MPKYLRLAAGGLAASLAAGVALLAHGSLAASPGAWPWSESLDAARAAPQHHKLLYEDDRVRIFELDDTPGEGKTIPAHTHRYPAVMLVDQDNRYTLKFTCDHPIYCNGGKAIQNKPDPSATYPLILRLPPQGPHTVTYAPASAGNTNFHAYRIEFKQLPGLARP